MHSLSKIVLFLMLLAVSSTELESNNPNSTCAIRFSYNNHCSNDSTCPAWFTCNAEKRCQCDKQLTNNIVCDDEAQISAVVPCYCATYDLKENATYVGVCFYNCKDRNPSIPVYESLKELPKNPEMLINNSACTLFHRAGLLCGDCEEGYSPPVLSYNLSCVECPDGHKNWWRFILAGFMPLTIFYFFVLAFNINVTSSRLHGVVWFSQAISTPTFVRTALYSYSITAKEYLKAVKVGVVFYSLWNLDLFRSVIPDICLNVTTFQALAMEYLFALYPFVLILFSYFLIVLHDRQVRVVVTVWKPFRKVLTIFRKSWDIRTSVLDSFATFFFLSYNKVFSVTFDMLMPTKIYQLGSNKTMIGPYYSPSMPYFGDQHLPYAILAIIIIIHFVCIPTIILILYPCNFFQKFLSLFPINWHFLHAFVDAFQGCYKDGTEPGTFDCRWFSVLMLLIWPLQLIIYSLSLSYIYFVYGLIILLVLLIAMTNFQPLKKVSLRYHQIDLIFTFLLCFTFIAIMGRGLAGFEIHIVYYTLLTVIALVTGIFPLLYISFLIGSWFFSKIHACISQCTFH